MSDEIKKYEQKPLVIPENANLDVYKRQLQVWVEAEYPVQLERVYFLNTILSS